ncbi:uncharacterized protein OCT59_003971 [Rhizophagus irregularis]|uniref:uncharacterized protein n=1 Tax=Rhizophagus irregularis TaxID=588596 RepID=UPI0019F5759F|nr:hypothetical protein OCT59_003971 [Rhizophagus irregularis]GBC53328.2 hypothetical protein GLOIN_2v1883106 [Rhizophagus irregularis DAOM 181602=DAOM 197198]
MDINWDFFINFPKDTILPTNFFIENNEKSILEDIITPSKFPEYFFNELEENVLENIIIPPNSPEHLFNELKEKLTELFNGLNDSLNCSSYQYNLCIEDSFNDWTSVDTFLHNNCLERSFRYQW